MSLTVLYWIVLIVMLVGVVGSIVPGIPGPSLILVGVLVWCIATGFATTGWWLAAIIFVLVLSVAVEFLATYWGARQVGASKWGQIGAIIGMVVGILGLLPALPVGGPLVGIIVGPVLGAFIGEMLYRRDLALAPRAVLSLKVAVAVVVGSLIGNVVEFLLAIAAVGIFILNTWSGVMT
ncbi:MAG: DUF456 domain-containing protein [Leptolyngbyaceae cyanobacterium SL_7_1]|nr:DUF456 domain-containing protein [Leptolyngbyaceae cyanobacterium SL_7_1]